MILIILTACTPDTTEAGPKPPRDTAVEPVPPEMTLTQIGADLVLRLPRYPGADIQIRRSDIAGSEEDVLLDSYGSFAYRSPSLCDEIGTDIVLDVSLDGTTWWSISQHLDGYITRGDGPERIGSLNFGPLVSCGTFGPEAGTDTITLESFGEGEGDEFCAVEVDAPLIVSIYNPDQPFPPTVMKPEGAMTSGYVALLEEAPFYYIDLIHEAGDEGSYVFVMYAYPPGR